MPRVVVYQVSEEEVGGWTIDLFGRRFGPCASAEEAVQTAIPSATRAVERGCFAEIQILSAKRFVAVWSNGAFTDLRNPDYVEAL